MVLIYNNIFLIYIIIKLIINVINIYPTKVNNVNLSDLIMNSI